MIPGSFEYHVPQTLDEAIALLARLGEGAKILAGGQSLLPAMRFRLASPEVLVDLTHRMPPASVLPGSSGAAELTGMPAQLRQG